MCQTALCAIVFSGFLVLPNVAFQLCYKMLKAFLGTYLNFLLDMVVI